MVVILGVVGWSLLSAAAYGLAAVFQHRAAVAQPPELSMTPGLLARLLRQPMWLAGNLLDVVGFGFQFLALRRGSLALVEPILVASLPMALPVAAVLERRRIGAGELGSALLVTAGIAGFLAVGRPGLGQPVHHRGVWLGLSIGVAVVDAVLVLVARGRSARRAALSLAAGSGITFGYVAALTSRLGHLLDHGLVHAVVSWVPYGLIAAAVLALLLTQSAFQAGSLRLSLPTLTLVQPLVAIGIGVGVFGQRLEHHGLAPLGEGLGLAAMAVGVVLLARPSTVGAAADPDGSDVPGSPGSGDPPP